MNAIDLVGIRQPRVPEDMTQYAQSARMAQSCPLVTPSGALNREAVRTVAIAARDVAMFDWPMARRLIRRLAEAVTRDNALEMLQIALMAEEPTSPLMPHYALGFLLADEARAQGFYLCTVDHLSCVVVMAGERSIVYRHLGPWLPLGTLVLLPRRLPRMKPANETPEGVCFELSMETRIIWRRH